MKPTAGYFEVAYIGESCAISQGPGPSRTSARHLKGCQTFQQYISMY